MHMNYTTFMKLVLVAPTGDTTGFEFTQPGAIHKARWMGKSNYAIPMVLLKTKIANELGRDTVIMTKAQVPLLERFVKFICIVYVKWWIRCPLPAECGLSTCSCSKTFVRTRIKPSPQLQRKLSIFICGT